MRLFSRVRELEEQNRDLNRRLESVEEYIYRQDISKLLKKYSEKYEIKIELSQFVYNGQYLLIAKDNEQICGIPYCGGMAGVYEELRNAEDKIKAFLYDREKEEETNDKE